MNLKSLTEGLSIPTESLIENFEGGVCRGGDDRQEGLLQALLSGLGPEQQGLGNKQVLHLIFILLLHHHQTLSKYFDTKSPF